MRLLPVLLFTVLATNSIVAQEMPSQVRDKLQQIVGTWHVRTVFDDHVLEEEALIQWTSDQNTIIYQGDGTDFITGIPVTFSGMLGWDVFSQKIVERGFDSAGGTITATHAISDQHWVSPMRASVVEEGRASIETSDRIFQIKSANEWTIQHTKRLHNGVPVKSRTSNFQRIETESDPIAERLVIAEIDRFRKYWSQGKAAELAQEFAPNGIRATNISTLPIVGHDAIQKSFAHEFSAGTSQSGAKLNAEVVHARFVTEKHLVGHGTWWLTEPDGTISRQGKWGNVWVVNHDHSDCKLLLESAYADLPGHQRKLPSRGHDLPSRKDQSDSDFMGMAQRSVDRFTSGFSNSNFAKVANEFTIDGVRSVSSLPDTYRGRAAILKSLKLENEGVSTADHVKLEAVVLNAQKLSTTIGIANGLWQLTDKEGNLIDYGQWGNVMRIRNGEAKLLLESAGSYQP